MMKLLYATAFLGFFVNAAYAANIDHLVYEAARATERFSYIADASDADHWISPAELAARRGGDCEDFAHFWQSYLLAHGVPASHIEQRVLKNKDGSHHMVLIVRGEYQDYVLSASEQAQGVYEMTYLKLWE